MIKQKLLMYAITILVCILFTKSIMAQTGATCASPLSLTISPGGSTGWQSTSLDTIWYNFTAPNKICNFRFHTSLKNKKCVNDIKYGVCGTFDHPHLLNKENDTTFYLTFVNLTAGNSYKLAQVFGLTGNCTSCSNIGEYKVDFVSSYSTATTNSASASSACEYILNGSFEQNTTPNGANQIHFANGWTTANNATPDLYSTSSIVMPIPTNGDGCENVRLMGQTSYAGFVSYDSPAHYEAIRTTLQAPLIGGQTYNITFYLSLAECSSVNADKIGFAFANNYIPNPSTTAFGAHYPTVSVNTSNVAKNGWTAFSYNYVANGNETDFIIGTIAGVPGLGTSPIDAGTCTPPGYAPSYYYLDDISIVETITAVASPTSICAGSSSTLTAAGGSSTYTWSTGANTPTISVTPSVTTIYTVTSTTSFGCLTTATVMVTVNSSYCCQTPTKVFTTGNWSAQTASTSVGAVLIEITGTVIMDANVTMTKTIVRMAPNAKLVIAASKTLTLVGAHLFSCNYMWEGIEMSNNSGLVTNRATLPTVNPTLDDANVGIYSDAAAMGTPASIVLNYLQLSKNHIGVKIKNYSSTTPYPFGMGAVNIQGNMGTTYSPGAILKTYLSPAPINYASTEYGVLLEDVNAAVVGSSSGARNTFKQLQNGVRLVRSNAHVKRNDFSDFGTSYNNKAIWAVGDYVTSPAVPPTYIGFGTKHRFLVGLGTSNHCTFKNLKYGIYTDSCMTNNIQNNDFKDINGTGVAVCRSNFFRGIQSTQTLINYSDRDTSLVYNNKMASSGSGSNLMQNGTGFFDDNYLYNVVTTNTISLKPSTGIWSEGVGIYHGASNTYADHYVQGNLINGNGNYGVHQINAANILKSVESNTITVGTGYCAGFFDTPNVGVYSVNSPYATIKENIIDETSLGTAPACMIGIYISNGQADYIGCNLMKNNDISCAVDQNNIASVYRGNVMNTALIGLYNVNGTLGNVGAVNDAAQNEWISSTWSTFVANATGGDNIYHDSGTNRTPTVNGFSSASPFAPALTTTGTLGCTQHHKGGSNSQIQPSSVNDSLVTDIINGIIQFPQYHDGLLWEHKNGILNLLKDSLLDNSNPLFNQFRVQQAASNLGKINTLMRSLGNYADVLQNKNTYLQNLNSITTTTNVVENNYKQFIYQYLNNIAGVTSISVNTYNAIKQLAQKCPYSDGVIVYHARALMKIWGDDHIYHNACEVMVMPTSGDYSKTGKIKTILPTENILVYPNPNNGTFSIAYSFEQSMHTFELYDLMGRKVNEKVLNGNEGVESINLNNINHGIYFYKVVGATGKMLFSGKLIISK